jgi:hypothetical protein
MLSAERPPPARGPRHSRLLRCPAGVRAGRRAMPCRKPPTPEQVTLVSSLLADAASPPEQLYANRRCRRPAHRHGLERVPPPGIAGDCGVGARAADRSTCHADPCRRVTRCSTSGPTQRMRSTRGPRSGKTSASRSPSVTGRISLSACRAEDASREDARQQKAIAACGTHGGAADVTRRGKLAEATTPCAAGMRPTRGVGTSTLPCASCSP